jgi:hypothetical protein
MSKSTPLAHLPNLKRQGPNQTQAHEQHENQIVKEILNEIDNSSNGGAQQQPQAPEISAEVQQQMLQQQVQQQMMEQQLMEDQMRQQQMAQQPGGEPEQNLESLGLSSMQQPQRELSLIENLMLSLKPTIAVAVIVAILSLPFVADTISKLVASKESLQKLALPILLCVKAVIGGGMFFAANNAGVLN